MSRPQLPEQTSFPSLKGTTFFCANSLTAVELSGILCRIAQFIQTIAPYSKLERYDDWLEHDGLYFFRRKISVEDLFDIVHSPRSLLESMPGDFDVFIGISDQDTSFYLRFYLDWDENDSQLVGRFDITLVPELLKKFANDVLTHSTILFQEADSEVYFA